MFARELATRLKASPFGPPPLPPPPQTYTHTWPPVPHDAPTCKVCVSKFSPHEQRKEENMLLRIKEKFEANQPQLPSGLT